MQINIKIGTDALPLPLVETYQCFTNFLEQLSLFRKYDYLDRTHLITFNSVQVSISPSHGSWKNFTYAKAAMVLANLFKYMYAEGLMYELRFAVFDMGLFVAWGTVMLRAKSPSQLTSLPPQPIPTAIQ